MLILFETQAGYALFKFDKKLLKKVDNLEKEFNDFDQISNIIKLEAFKKFKDSKASIKSFVKLGKGKLCKSYKKFLKDNIISRDIQDTIQVQDSKLATSIVEKMGLDCKSESKQADIFRLLRTYIPDQVTDFSEKELNAMSLGLAHGSSRQKLKFSSDKVDTMIIQAIHLLEEVDKEMNNQAMRLKEWFGWHFPELVRSVTDIYLLVKVITLIKNRANLTDRFDEFAGPLTELVGAEEVVAQIKKDADISMGVSLSEADEIHIQELGNCINDMLSQRKDLANQLQNRMMMLAPNLTVLVGDLVGAKLIAAAGSLVNLAKYPASTLQILGAEKALFQALKQRKDTPKQGILFHASLVGQANSKVKGNVSRSLAAKASLAVRVDAFSNVVEEMEEGENCKMGLEMKSKIENRLQFLENKSLDNTNKNKFNMKKDDNNLKRKRDDNENRDNPRKFKN